MEKVVCSKIYLRGGVLKMHVLYFGEGRDDNPYDDIINKKKKHEKVFINVKLIFGINRNYLNKFIILDNCRKFRSIDRTCKNVAKKFVAQLNFEVKF